MSHIIYIWNVFVLPIKLAIFGCFTESVRNIPRNRLLLLSSRQDNFNIFPDKSIIKQDNINISGVDDPQHAGHESEILFC